MLRVWNLSFFKSPSRGSDVLAWKSSNKTISNINSSFCFNCNFTSLLRTQIHLFLDFSVYSTKNANFQEVGTKFSIYPLKFDSIRASKIHKQEDQQHPQELLGWLPTTQDTNESHKVLIKH